MASSMKFETLSDSYGSSLLDFELANKAYFEQFIAPRKPSFYSQEGIKSHIEESENYHRLKQAKSYLLVHTNRIIARANIKHIKDGQAEIGYRVAQQWTGQGIAKRCIAHLITQARRAEINTLFAEVMDNNTASDKALLSAGFLPYATYIDKHLHRGIRLNSTVYRLFLP